MGEYIDEHAIAERMDKTAPALVVYATSSGRYPLTSFLVVAIPMGCCLLFILANIGVLK